MITAEEYLEERKRRQQDGGSSKKQASQGSVGDRSFSNAEEYLAYRAKRIQAENQQFAVRARAARADKYENLVNSMRPEERVNLFTSNAGQYSGAREVLADLLSPERYSALEDRARNTYIPAQFWQKFADNERNQQYAQRYQNTYVPASLAQDAIHRSGTGNDFNAYSDAALRGEYLNKVDTGALQAELDALNAELSENKRYYDGAKRSLDSIARVKGKDDPTVQSYQKTVADYEEKQARAAQLQRDIHDSDAVKKYNAYESLRANADFAERSQAAGSKRVQFDLLDPSTWGVGDDKYDFVNDIDGYRNTVKFLSETQGAPTSYGLYSALSHITDDEKAMYNYLYATKGKEAAEEYLNYIEEGLNYRQGKAEADIVGDNLLKASGYGIRTGAERFASGISGMFSDEAKAPAASEYGAQFVRENLADTGFKLPEWMGGASVGQTVFDLSNTAGNMAPSILLSVLTAGAGAPTAVASGVASASMGLSAGGSAKAQAIREGYTPEQATRYGVLIGASEGALQYLLGGIGKLGGKLTGGVAQKAIQNIDDSLLRIAATGAIKMAGEGTEEYLQEILDPIYRNLLFNENNQIDLTDPEAVYSFLLGALTSVVMDGSDIVKAGKARPSSLPNVNGALVAADAAQNVPSEQTVAQNAAQETEQYVYTDETTGIPMVGTRPVQSVGIDVGAATHIQEPYTGKTPVQTQNVQRTEVNIPYEKVSEARAHMKEAEANKGGKSFASTLKDIYKKLLEGRFSGQVEIPGVAFNGAPYFATINNSVIGKVISDKNMSAEKLSVLENLQEVVKNAEYVGSGRAKNKKDAIRYDYFEARARVDGERYIVKLDVEAREDKINRVRTYQVNNIDLVPSGNTHTGTTPVGSAPIGQGLFINSIPQTAEKSNTAGGIYDMNSVAPGMTQIPEAAQNTILQPEGHSDTISLEEEGAIRSYKSGMASYAINEKLYSDVELDEADKSLVKNLDAALEKLPDYEGTTYRVLCFDRQGKDAYDAFIARHVPNTLILYGSYTSTSKTPDAFDIDGTLKVRIEIEGKTGKDVSEGFGLEAEQEVLYGRNVCYTTKAVETAQDGTHIIKIKEVNLNDEGVLPGREKSVDSANQGNNPPMREMQEVEGLGRAGSAGVRSLSEWDTQSANSGKSRPLQGELSGRQRDSRGARGSERSADGAVRGQTGDLAATSAEPPLPEYDYDTMHDPRMLPMVDTGAEQRVETNTADALPESNIDAEPASNAEITEHLRKLKQDVLTMEIDPDRTYTDAERKALANKRITEYTANDIYLLASSLKEKRGLYLKDVGRVLDTVAGNRDVRQALHNLIEVGYNAALGEHGRRQTRDLTELQERYKKHGIKPGSKESAAVMKFGQRGYFDRDGKWVEYTLGDLRAEFPNKWKDIMETAQEDRAQYDAYIDEANEMRERIYPKAMEQAQMELENAKETAARNSELAAHQKETIATIEAKIESYRETLSGKKRTDTAAYVKLKNGIAYQERRLKSAQGELNRAEQRAENARFKAARLAEEIRNGEPLHQKKIERRKDYYHHVRASGLTFDLATLIGSKSAASELVAGRIAAGSAGGRIGNAIDRIIDSVLGNKSIAPGMVGVSDNTSPRTKWQSIMEHQGAGAYKLDSFASMADYIGMIDYMLAFDEYTSQLRDITNTIRAAADRLDKRIGESAREANSLIEWMKDWGDMLTGKTLPLDRGVQKNVGRNVMNGVRKLNSAVRSSTLLANIRSMIVQGSAIANAMNYIQNPADWARGMRYMANAMTGDAEYANAIAQSNFLSQRNMLSPSDIVKGSLLDQGKKPLGKMLNIGQNAVDKLTWWTAYAQYNAASETPGGLDKLNRRFTRAYDNAIDYADDITRRSVAGRGVGEQPMRVKSTVVDTLAPFQTEVLNNFNTMKENIGTLLGRGSTKEQRARAAAGLVSYEIAAFAINLIAKGLFNDDIVPFDFIGALAGAFFDDEDDEEDEKNNFGQRLYHNVAGTTLSGIPFSSTVVPMLMDDETSQVIFGADGDPSRYGTGIMGTNALADVAKTFIFDRKNATDWERLNAAAAFFPLGGKQIARSAQGIYTVVKGGSYKKDAEGDRLQYRTDRGALDFLQAGAFGKWALPEAREYVDKGFPILSVPDTTAYKNAIANGVDGAHFLLLLDEYKNLEPIKDADGNTEKNKNQQFREILFRDSSLTPEQKKMIDRDVIRQEKTADYTSKDRFIISTTPMEFIHLPKDDNAYERFTENVKNGMSEEDAALVEEWAQRLIDIETYTDEDGNEIEASQQKREMLFKDPNLTPEQKEMIDRQVIMGDGKKAKPADYSSSEAMMEASQLKGAHADKVKFFEAAGGTAEKYLSYYNLYSGLEPTKDINGEEIAGSREEALRNEIMNDDDMTPAQKRQLDEALTGGKTRNYISRFAFDLTKISKTAYKRGKAYVAAGISEAKAIQIEQWMSGRDYKKEDLRKYLVGLNLPESQIEAVLKARY